MTRFVKWLAVAPLLSALMLFSGWVAAAEVANLYKASVEVPDRSVAARDLAVSQGLGRVLVRVSGNSSITTQESVRTVLQDASRFVVQFSYQSQESLSPEDGSMVKAIVLKVSFDEAAINQFLRREGFPIWASSRPNVVLWAAVSGDGGRQLVGGQQQPALQQLLLQQAERRGLPLIIPQYDADDLAQVRAGDVWGMFVEPIAAASQRYDANVVSVVKILVMPDSVQVSAALTIDERQQWWEFSAESLELAVTALMDQLGDRVGERFAVQASMAVGEQVVLDVIGVKTLKDYARLGEYLDGVLAIRGWHLSLAQGAHHQYRITLESTLEALEQGLRLDRKLLPQPSPLVVPLGAESAVEPALEPEELESLPDQAADRQDLEGTESGTAAPVLYYRWNG